MTIPIRLPVRPESSRHGTNGGSFELSLVIEPTAYMLMDLSDMNPGTQEVGWEVTLGYRRIYFPSCLTTLVPFHEGAKAKIDSAIQRARVCDLELE